MNSCTILKTLTDDDFYSDDDSSTLNTSSNNDNCYKKCSMHDGTSEYRQVLCDYEQTTAVIKQIQNKLKEESFYSSSITGLMDDLTKSALVSYQKSKKLPVGHLDLETLDALHITLH